MFPLIFLMGVRSEVLDLIASRVAEICEIDVQLSEKDQLSEVRRQKTDDRKQKTDKGSKSDFIMLS